MFCEDPEDIKMVDYLVDTLPGAEAHIVDLMYWCYKYRNSEYLALLEKYKEYKGEESQMINFSDIDYEIMKTPVKKEEDISQSDLIINGET